MAPSESREYTPGSAELQIGKAKDFMESDEKKPVRESTARGILKTLAKTAVAALIIWYLFRTGGDRAKDWTGRLHGLNWVWLIPAAILYAFHIFVNAWRWHLLLTIRKIPCSLFNACSLTMQSFFFSLVMPGGAIGGDVVRAGFLARALPREKVFEGVFTILMDRFTGMLGIFALALLSLPFIGRYIGAADELAGLFIWILLAGSAAGLAGAVVVFRHRWFNRFFLYRKLRELTDRFTGSMFSKMEETLDQYQNAKKEIVICVLASIIGVNLVLAVVMYCVCLAFAPASEISVPAILGAITIGNIAGLIPATPSGVGMRDYFVMTILAASAFPADPLLPTIVMTLLIIGFNLAGGLFFLISPHPKSEN